VWIWRVSSARSLRDLTVEVAKLSSTMAELHGRQADFKFAREKGGAEFVDVP
jgi:hypothetical protein